jgi:hypothetical protein
LEKIAKAKRAGNMAQVGEHLPSKHNALGSNSTITTLKRREDIEALELKSAITELQIYIYT